jgi:hypothetical protein
MTLPGSGAGTDTDSEVRWVNNRHTKYSVRQDFHKYLGTRKMYRRYLTRKILCDREILKNCVKYALFSMLLFHHLTRARERRGGRNDEARKQRCECVRAQLVARAAELGADLERHVGVVHGFRTAHLARGETLAARARGGDGRWPDQMPINSI